MPVTRRQQILAKIESSEGQNANPTGSDAILVYEPELSQEVDTVERVDDWLEGLGHRFSDFEETLFYSDSTNDLPLLERVRVPVATNLARYAGPEGRYCPAGVYEYVKSDDGSDAKWKVENGYVEIVPRTGRLVSKEKFGDCQLHVEWMIPKEATGAGQGQQASGKVTSIEQGCGHA